MENPNRIWLISDTHFNHRNILKFEASRKKNYEDIIFKNIGAMVGPKDTLIHLGDFTFGHKEERDRAAERWANLVVGQTILVLGNHDRHPLDYYYEQCGFKYVYSLFYVLGNVDILLSHFPMAHAEFSMNGRHPDEDTRYPEEKAKLRKLFDENDMRLNIHGHTHSLNIPDPQYCNVSVEATGYKPVLLADILGGVYKTHE